MHEEMKAKMREISELKEKLVDSFKCEMARGVAEVDTHEAGQVVDMIKDLAETEKLCYEACYYETVIEAMDGGDEDDWDDERMGYNPNRGADGRYTSGRSGRGGMRVRSRMGYKKPIMYKPYMDEYPYVRDWMDDPDEFRSHMMGYRDSDAMRSGEMGMPRESREGREDNRYGRAYSKYQEARRHYTKTQSPEDREMMRQSANEHVADMMVTVRDMWQSADPDLKKQMKADMTKLVGEMNV